VSAMSRIEGEDMAPLGMKRLGFDAHGRNVALVVDTETDQFGQFKAAIVVDGKEMLSGWFTSREDDE
jgi:hypothetical protein